MFRFNLPVLCIALLLTACGPVEPLVKSNTTPSVDLNHYKTFSFFDKLDTDRRYESLLSQYLKQATIVEMTQRGFRYVETEADILINFNQTVSEKQTIRHLPKPNHGGYYTADGRFYQDIWIDYEPVLEQYQQGQLTIDLVDRQTNKMVWQGIALERMNNLENNTLSLTIPKIVSKIFTQFPIQPNTLD